MVTDIIIDFFSDIKKDGFFDIDGIRFDSVKRVLSFNASVEEYDGCTSNARYAFYVDTGECYY